MTFFDRWKRGAYTFFDYEKRGARYFFLWWKRGATIYFSKWKRGAETFFHNHILAGQNISCTDGCNGRGCNGSGHYGNTRLSLPLPPPHTSTVATTSVTTSPFCPTSFSPSCSSAKMSSSSWLISSFFSSYRSSPSLYASSSFNLEFIIKDVLVEVCFRLRHSWWWTSCWRASSQNQPVEWGASVEWGCFETRWYR